MPHITLPTYYQIPFLHHPYPKKQKKWQTTLSVSGLHTWATRSYGDKERKIALFDYARPIQLTRLGLNLENLTNNTTYPKTYEYWGPGKPFANPTLTLTDDDGQLSVKGAFHNTQVTINLKQVLPSNFYIFASVPFREVKAHKISYELLGAQTINTVDMQDFVDKKLPDILAEHNIKPLTDVYKSSGVADASCALGWWGKTSNKKGPIQSIQGSAQASFILPTGTPDIDHALAIPYGHGKNLGFGFEVMAEASLKSFISIGIQAHGYIFLKKDRTMHLKTDKDQQGLAILEKARVSYDKGSVWDLAGYVAFDKFVDGLSIIIGYSLAEEDTTSIHVLDENFLKTARENAITNNNDPSKTSVPFINPDDIANRDKRFDGWQAQTVHAAITYQLTDQSSFSPILAFEYSYPISGKHRFCTESFGGTFGVSFSLSL